MTRKSFALSLCVGLFVSAPAFADVVMLSVADNVGSAIGGVTDLTDIDVVQYDTVGDSASIILEQADFDLGSGDTNALHYMPNGNIVISNLFNGRLAGVAYEDDDLLEYNPNTNTATLLFDGSTAFGGTSDDIDGIYIRENGNFVMSTVGSSTIGGLNVLDGDVFEYNPNTNVATLLISEAGLFDDGAGDVDAVHVLDNGNFLLSFLDTTDTVSGVSFLDGDVFEYDPINDTATLYMSESVYTSAGLANDTDAFTLVPEPGTFGLLFVSIGMVLRRRKA